MRTMQILSSAVFVILHIGYDTLGNLVLEKIKNNVVDYQYNELNRLAKKKMVMLALLIKWRIYE